MASYFITYYDKREISGQWIFTNIADARKRAYSLVSADDDGEIIIGKIIKGRTKSAPIKGKAVGTVIRDDNAKGKRIIWNADTKEKIGIYTRSIPYILNKDGSLGAMLDPFKGVERRINRMRRA